MEAREQLIAHLKTLPKEELIDAILSLMDVWNDLTVQHNLLLMAIETVAPQQNLDGDLVEMVNKNFWELLNTD